MREERIREVSAHTLREAHTLRGARESAASVDEHAHAFGERAHASEMEVFTGGGPLAEVLYQLQLVIWCSPGPRWGCRCAAGR